MPAGQLTGGTVAPELVQRLVDQLAASESGSGLPAGLAGSTARARRAALAAGGALVITAVILLTLTLAGRFG